MGGAQDYNVVQILDDLHITPGSALHTQIVFFRILNSGKD